MNSYAQNLSDELVAMNGDFTLVSGDARCDTNVSIWGYQDLIINLESGYDIYLGQINEGRSSGRCMDGIGSKSVSKTVFKNKTLTHYVGKKRIGCFTPNWMVKLVKESELKIANENSFTLTSLMRSDRPIQCFYTRTNL